MARLWTGGFEHGGDSTTEMQIGGNSGILVVSTSPVRTGTYSGRANNPSGGDAASGHFFNAVDGNGPYYFRFYIYIAHLPGVTTTICMWEDVLINNAHGHIRLTPTGTLQLMQPGFGNTQIGSDSAAMASNQWHRIEVKFDRTGGAGASTSEARLNGTIFATSSTQTFTTGMSGFETGINIFNEGDTVGDFYFDDLAVNDTTGSFQNGYPGDGSIIYLYPNAAGDNNAWTTNVGGTAGTSNNYTRVDEVTPNDTTDYNADKTLNRIDDFNIADTPSTLKSNDFINVVHVGVRYNGAAGSANSSFVVRAKKAASGTVSESSAITPADTNWYTNAGAVPAIYPLTLHQNPDAAAWTKALIDTTQIGYRVSTANTNNAQISTVYAVVEYVPTLLISTSELINISESIGRSLVISLVGKGVLGNLRFRSVDTMKKNKDTIASQPNNTAIDELNTFIAQNFNVSHIAISPPFNTDAEFTSAGASTPSPQTIFNFTAKWFDSIHAQGKKVIYRGAMSGWELNGAAGLYNFPLKVGANRYTMGTVASAPTDGSSTFYGMVYAWIVAMGSHWEHGDIFAAFPERTENNIQQRTITSLTRSGSTATATFSGNHDIANGEPVKISGATQTEYNGQFIVTKLSDSSFSYTVSGTPTTPATGSPISQHGVSPYDDAFTFYPASGSGLTVDYANFFIDIHTIAAAAFKSIGKNVFTGWTANNWSELNTGWIPSSLFTDAKAAVFDHYGVTHTSSEMGTDLDNTYSSKGQPMFHQEWGDYWNGTTYDATRLAYLRDMYSVMGVRADNNKTFAFNYWGGWDGGSGEQLFSYSSGYSLLMTGQALQEAFNGTSDIVNVYEWTNVVLISNVNETENITITENASGSITTSGIYAINVNDSITVTENKSVFTTILYASVSESITVSESFSVTVGGNAITLNGSSQYGIAANWSAIDAMTAGTGTIEGWFWNDPASNAYSAAHGLGNGTTNRSSLSTENGTGSTGVNFSYSYTGSPNADGYYPSGVFDQSTWVHIAEIFTAGAKTKVIKNGTEIGYNLQQTPGGSANSLTGYSFYLGQNGGTGSIKWKGKIGGYIRVWNRALSISEINSNKNLLSVGDKENGLIINANFREQSGTTIDNDVTGGSDITLYGTPNWTAGPTGLLDKLYVSVSDSITVSEGISVAIVTLGTYLITTSESITITESIGELDILNINVSESITVSESYSVVEPFNGLTVNKTEEIQVLERTGLDYCLTFDASQNYVLLKNGPILSGSANWFIAFDFSTTQTGYANEKPMYCERAATGNDILKVETLGTNGGTPGQVWITFRDDAGTLNRLAKTTATYNDGNVHSLYARKIGTSVIMVIDGVTTSSTVTATDTFTNSGIETRVGSDKADGTVHFGGTINNLRVGTTPTNLLGNWPLNEGTGITATDVSGTGNDGTLTGTPVPTWTLKSSNEFLTINLSISDSVTVSENIIASIPGTSPNQVNVSDSITITESIGGQPVSFVNVSDSTTITESIGSTIIITLNVRDGFYRDGLVFYVKFDENTGSSVADIKGATGTWQGTLGSQWTTGKINSGGNFNGTNNYVDFGTVALDIAGDHAYSISAWVNPTATVLDGSIIGYGAAVAHKVISLSYINSSATLYSIHYADDHSWAINLTLSGGMQLVTQTYDPTSSTETLYVNGVSMATWSPGDLNLPASGSLWIGGSFWNTTKTKATGIDEVAIWNKTLSPDEVAGLYNRGSGYQYNTDLSITESLNETLTYNVSVSDSVTLSESVGKTLTNNVNETEYIFARDYRQNLIPNPSFEVNTSNWYGTADNSSAPNGVYTRSTTQALFGSGSLKYTHTGANIAIYSHSIPVVPGKTYTASAYFYLEAGYTGNCTIDIMEYSSGILVLDGANSANIGVTGSWVRASVTQTIGPTTDTVFIRMVNDGTAGGTAYGDGFQFELGNSATTYIDGTQASCQWDGTANASTSSTSAENVTLVDLVNVSDNITVTDIPRNWQDTVYVFENVNTNLVNNVNVSENIAVTENISVSLIVFGFSINVSDTITASEYSPNQDFVDKNIETNLSSWYAGQQPSDLTSGIRVYNDPMQESYTDGDSLATIHDFSGNGYDAIQSTSSKKPTFKNNNTDNLNGNKAYQFDGNDVISNTTAPVLASSWTTLTVLTRLDNAQPATFLGLDTAGSYPILSHYVGTYYLNPAGSPSNIQTTDIPASPVLLIAHQNATTSKISMNGNTEATGSLGFSYLSGGYVLGAYETGGAQPIYANIYASVQYSADLSGQQINDLSSYFGLRFGLTLGSGWGANVTRDTGTFYTGSASMKVVTNASYATPVYQKINPGARPFVLIAYAYTDGSPVTSSDVELYYNGSAVSTSYTSVGGGWYQLLATITHDNTTKDFGAHVKAGKTVYLDSFNFSLQNPNVEEVSLVNKSESISISEALTASLVNFDRSINVSDSINVAESVNSLKVLLVIESESITVSESTSLFETINLSVSETITISESIGKQSATFISTSDSITLTESIGTFESITINTSQLVTVLESTGQDYSLRFDGSQNYLNLGKMGNLGGSLGSGVYMKFDIKMSSTVSGSLGSCSNGGKTALVIDFHQNASGGGSTNRTRVWLRDENGLFLAMGTTNTYNYSDGNNHTFVITMDGSTNSGTISIDGNNQAITYSTQTTPVTFANFLNDFLIAAANEFGIIQKLNATIDNFRIGTSSSTLYGLYFFNEGSGTTTADSSGNGNTGTLIGSPLPIWNVNANDIAITISPAVSDSITVSENVNELSTLLISVQDSITILDIFHVTFGGLLSGYDNVFVTEEIHIRLVSLINKSESITVSENVKAERIFTINLFETITVTEFFGSFTLPVPGRLDIDHGVGESIKITDVEVKGENLFDTFKVIDQSTQTVTNVKLTG